MYVQLRLNLKQYTGLEYTRVKWVWNCNWVDEILAKGLHLAYQQFPHLEKGRDWSFMLGGVIVSIK